jgi:WD40 repeat protein
MRERRGIRRGRVPFDVFISYSSQDKTTADAACAALEASNIRCWIAPRDINPGRDYGESIIDAIESARLFVLIFSSNANTSPQVKREVERAVSKGLPIIPVRIEDIIPNRTLEYFISSPHWLDAFPPPRDRYFAKLVVSVRVLLETDKSETPQTSTAAVPPASWEEKRPTRRRLGLIIAAATAITFTAAGGYTVYLLKTEPLVRTLTVHGDGAISVAFSPDGHLIAAAANDPAIYVWSATDGQLQPPVISASPGHAAPFSPDGKWIAAGSDSDVMIWDAATKRVLKKLSGHSGKVLTVAFSRDGKSLVSGAKDNAVFIWDLAGNQPERRLAGHNDLVYSVAFSSDGNRIASAGFDQKVIVWDVASGQVVKTLPDTTKMMDAIFSSDDTWLATAGQDGVVTVWDTSSWQVVRKMPRNGEMVTAIAFSPDDKLIASAGGDGVVRVWDTDTQALVRAYTGHAGTVWAVGFSPDGQWIASASSDKTVKIWKAPRID